MVTRRRFLLGVGAAGAAAATLAVGSETADPPSEASRSQALHQGSPMIRGASRREDAVLRLGGFGDDYHMTWASDDRQYVSVCDGLGWYRLQSTSSGKLQFRLGCLSACISVET